MPDKLTHSPRLDLEQLPDDQLFNVARNPSAVHRKTALRILVERASLYAGHNEIANEARELVLQDPIVLKKVDPASGLQALRLPGVIDVLADLQTKRLALANQVAEHDATHTETSAVLAATVIDNKAANDRALRDASVALWKYVLKQAWQGVEDAATQKVAVDNQIAELREEHEKGITAASERLRLLERSPWRRLADWCKAHWARVRRQSKPDHRSIKET
jgi:hypothetical protein